MVISWTQNASLNRWIDEMVALCHPAEVHLCTGSEAEYDEIAQKMVVAKSLTPLNLQLRPHSFWCHSHPDDVARVEECTFICSAKEEDAGPTNHWQEPAKMKKKLYALFKGCMAGRTMYIVPYCMGPYHSPFAIVGVQITDSPYAVLNMKLMTRMGKKALEQLKDGPFIPGLHSVGCPLKKGEKDVPWPCNPKDRVIAHFPEERSIFSYGSGYGGNALLGKKCLALRIASSMGRDEGWMAEHMLILGITNPKGEKKYFAAAFPSACGKTNLAMMTPSLPGWKIQTVGDDIAWMRIGKDGRLYAVNPEAGYFGVAPGTSRKTNGNAMRTIEKNTIFTNVALTADKDVWWEGIGEEAPAHLTSWFGKPYDPASHKPAAHPNARFTVTARQNPIYDPMAEDPDGVPISAIIFGGRRATTVPLVTESFSWNHGVFFGASVSSEMTAAAKGEVGKLRHDPFAMLPFCGYHMGDYFGHWIEMGKKLREPPRIYAVNWFRKSAEGEFLWPGFGENARVLQWIFDRTSNNAPAQETPIGLLPTPHALDLSRLNLPAAQELFSVDTRAWEDECEELSTYFQRFGKKMPKPLLEELAHLRQRLHT